MSFPPMSFSLAWRNIWRNKVRTALTLLAIAFATVILVFFVSLQFSSYDTSINISTSMFHGHLQVQNPEYFDKVRIRNTLRGAEKLRKKIEEVDGVVSASTRAVTHALTSSEDRTYGAQIVGVDPLRDNKTSTIASSIATGRYLTSNDTYQAIVGRLLAKNLKVSVGDDITVLGQGREGSLAATVVTVVGIFSTPSQDLDRATIEIPLLTFQDEFQMGNAAHSIVVMTDSLREAENIKPKIAALLNEEEAGVYIWHELLPGLKEAIELDLAASWLFYLGLVLIVALSIVNTFLMSVLERKREFGVMLALGMSPGRIGRLVFGECLILTSTGLLVGIALGSCLVFYYGIVGFSVPGSEEVMKLWNLPGAVYTRLTLLSVTLGPIVILTSALLAIIYPIIQIWQVRPVEAMRSV